MDAVFAPAWRYFDVFDAIVDLGVFESAPRVTAWRQALARRPSVVAALDPGYADTLVEFRRKSDAWMLRMAAASR